MTIYIKHLPKDKLLYELWLAARKSPNFYYCPNAAPILDLETARTDINHMIVNERRLDLSTYYGRMLYVDLTDDTFDSDTYDLYNGRGKASKIVRELKKIELKKTVLCYYKFY